MNTEPLALAGAIDQGLADSEAGRVISDAELRKRLDAKFGKPLR